MIISINKWQVIIHVVMNIIIQSVCSFLTCIRFEIVLMIVMNFRRVLKSCFCFLFCFCLESSVTKCSLFTCKYGILRHLEVVTFHPNVVLKANTRGAQWGYDCPATCWASYIPKSCNPISVKYELWNVKQELVNVQCAWT